VILIFPVVAPAGTVALRNVGASTWIDVDDIPLNLTDVAPVKFAPAIRILVPMRPVAGENALIVGTGIVTVNAVALVALPPGVTILIFPVVAPGGTIAFSDVAVMLLTDVEETPLNLTLVVPMRLEPAIVMDVPTGALAGVNDVIAGAAGVMTKALLLDDMPVGVVTLIGPVVAPAGTVALSDVGLTVVIEFDATPLNLTALTPTKLAPVIVTTDPTGPLPGENDPIPGGAIVTVKVVALVAVPTEVCTLTVPVVAPVGRVAVMRLSELTVNVVATVLLNFTIVAPVK